MNKSDNIQANDDLLTRLPASPDIYPQKIDIVRELALLVEFGQNAYRATSFLDDRILNPATRGSWAPLARAIAAAEQANNLRPLHFMFHTGHVGSTLVSRLLDEIPGVWSLREPLTLRTLAECADDLDQIESLVSRTQFDALLRMFLRLWSRGYESTHSIILKATSSAARVAQPLLAQQSSARAIYLNVRAEPYLATLLAGQNSPLDLRGHGPSRMRRLRSRALTGLAPLHSLSLGELAAMSWLAESWTQFDAVQALGDRILSVDFDRFLADVAGGLRQIVRHCDEPLLAKIATSTVLTRYSKATEYEYSTQIRAQLLADSRQRHRQEIHKGMICLERLAVSNPAMGAVLNTAY
jgi:hypothetical protein